MFPLQSYELFPKRPNNMAVFSSHRFHRSHRLYVASDGHGWARIILTTTNLELTTTILELTTTWTTITTKTTRPLATVSPLDVVYVVYVVVKLGVRRTKENLCNLCNLCDNKYPADWITYLVYVSGERWLQTPRKVVPFWQKGGGCRGDSRNT